ncbi:MAG: zinc ribbon domain-containing protein [Clostridia bacterium]|nr:zinc ribbon domain-containing protein [Clostridia bacterium]
MQTKELQSNNKNKASGGKIAGGTILLIVAAVLVIVGIILISKGTALKNSVSMSDPDWFDISSKGSGMTFGGIALCFGAVFCVVVGIVLLSTRGKSFSQAVIDNAKATIEKANNEARQLTEEERKAISEKMHATNRHMSNYFAGVVECKNCGHEVGPHDKKCKYCGTRVR